MSDVLMSRDESERGMAAFRVPRPQGNRRPWRQLRTTYKPGI